MNILLVFKVELDVGMLVEKEWQVVVQGKSGLDILLL